MRHIRLAALVFLLFFTASCEDSVNTPQQTNDDPKERVDSTGFAIVASTSDTLYYGEEAWIEVNELGNARDLRFFVHTVQVEEMWIDGNKLRFMVPRNASTGRMRLYKHDTLEAKNNFTLHVLPHHVDEFITAPKSYFPTEGYHGETITIHILDIPMRRREFDILLDDQKLKILQWDTARIIVEVPTGKRVGTLWLRAFGAMSPIGQFEVLEHDGIFMDQERLRSVSLQAMLLLGETVAEMTDPDSTMKTPMIAFSANATFEDFPFVTHSDSIRIQAKETNAYGEQTVDIALKPAQHRNTFSGTITITQHSEAGTRNEMIQTTTAILKDIPWKRVNGNYVIYAYGESIGDHLVSLSNVVEYPDFNYTQRIVEYEGGDQNSSFQILFMQ